MDRDGQLASLIRRDRGILTESDREYLLGKSELSPESAKTKRYRIRKRFEDALKDLVLMDIALYEGELDQAELEQAFSIEDGEMDDELAFALESMFYLTFYATPPEYFERALRWGVGDALEDEIVEKTGLFPDYGLQFQIIDDGAAAPMKELAEQAETEEAVNLDYRQLRALARFGQISEARMRELILAKPDDELAADLLYYRGVDPGDTPVETLRSLFGFGPQEFQEGEIEQL